MEFGLYSLDGSGGVSEEANFSFGEIPRGCSSGEGGSFRKGGACEQGAKFGIPSVANEGWGMKDRG